MAKNDTEQDVFHWRSIVRPCSMMILDSVFIDVVEEKYMDTVLRETFKEWFQIFFFQNMFEAHPFWLIFLCC